ncbi:hypothetical protein RQP46_001708 [Phenoliferia psychrophenolica]
MIPTPTFHTERLVFKAVNKDKVDIEHVKELNADPLTQAYANGTSKPYTDASAVKFLEYAERCLLAVYICLPKSADEFKVAGEVIGFMILGNRSPPDSPHRRSSFAIFFKPAGQDKGYGTEAMEWLLEQGFKSFNLHKIEGGTFGWNERARATYRKVGFREEGVLKEQMWQEGGWQDMIAL